jgi:hypothetical protein
MKVGILSESDADEAGIRILAQAVLGLPIDVLLPVRIRSRGWAAVFKNLPAFYQALHWRPDAEGLIVVVDSDDTTIHEAAHEDTGFNAPGCRCCEMQRAIESLQRIVPPRKIAPLKIAIGLAVPAIESWYLCGVDVHSTEARFARELPGSLYELRRTMKRKVYGSVSAPKAVTTERTVQHCMRLAADLSPLERHFPSGFGVLARSLRAWKIDGEQIEILTAPRATP